MNVSEYGDPQPDGLELAGMLLERHEMPDVNGPSLFETTGIAQHQMPTASGLNDYDYQNISSLTMDLKNLNQIVTTNKIPIPPEIMEHFKHIKCHCMMGLFPEIGRAWLTIDSDIYIWTYENTRDVAYFDGLNQVIVSVGMVKPKLNVFIEDVKFLLVLTTPIEIVVLGVTFGDSRKIFTSPTKLVSAPLYEEMLLMNQPIFVLSTDNVAFPTINSTSGGRIFMGGKDGCLYEISYQAESNWFGKRCKKVNLSQGIASYMIPGFLKIFSEVDSVSKIVIDEGRKLLYTLSEKGAIEVWDISTDCSYVKRVMRLSQNDIVNAASNILKTVDAAVFKPIVSICVLSKDDSPQLHLLAITQCGIRLYFTTTKLMTTQPMIPQLPAQLNQSMQIQQQLNQSMPAPTIGGSSIVDMNRSCGLYLMHVRLPPGYTPNTTIGKPKFVHSAFYKHGTLLMISTPQQDQDLLYALSSEPFPHRPFLVESTSMLQLEGQVWGIAEIPQNLSDGIYGPLQLAKNPQRVVLLTNQGAHIIAIMKPVDLLKQILLSCNGAQHDAVKSYFQIQGESQACATSLLLACANTNMANDLGIFATQAYFLYGGEPHYGNTGPYYQMQGNLNDPNQSLRNYPAMSTPYNLSPGRHSSPMHPNMGLSVMQQSQYPLSPINQTFGMAAPDPLNLNYSSKHAGIYLLLSRLLRPIWNIKCIDVKMQSNITYIDCGNILESLYALLQFYENSLMPNLMRMNADRFNAPGIGQANNSTIGIQERALLEERKSFDALHRLIIHSSEVIALWKVLCEHQINCVVQALPKEQQCILQTITFRDLILVRSDLCINLIVTLINSYLNDNASVGAISSKLRDICPNLYRREDAVSHKAAELIMASKACTDSEEREEKLRTALQLCKDAAPNIPLTTICRQFTQLEYYEGVIELCAICASKIDPTNVALHYYRNNEQIDDQEGYLAFTQRMNMYKEIGNMLDSVYLTLCNNYKTNPMSNMPVTALEREQNINRAIIKVISMVLHKQDILLYTEIYDWLLKHNLVTELLDIAEPSLGDYLERIVRKNPDNLQLTDLLWKYHEKNNKHLSASKILDELANKPSNSIDLEKRIEYLARAVMCLRSESIAYSPQNGAFLSELEDKLEISGIQKMVLEALRSSFDSEDRLVRDAITSLNYELYNITQLYTDFAEKFDLNECKLAILNCSHHNDPLLIESVWIQMLDKEYLKAGSPNDKAERMLIKVQTLAREYDISSHCFPLAFLVHELELRCCKLALRPSPVPQRLLYINADVNMLLDIYSRLLSLNERVWLNEGNEWHLVESVSTLITTVIKQSSQYKNKRRIVDKAKLLISTCLQQAYTKPGTDQIIPALREIQAQLERVPF